MRMSPDGASKRTAPGAVSYVGCSFVSEHDSAPHFDLQAHSTCSDGVLSPSEVVAEPHRQV